MSGESKKNILLVEDEAIIAMSEKMTLESFGYGVIIANCGEKALEILKNTPEIHLILMDINLGKGMDGPCAAQLILKDYDLPIVFLSSHTEREIVEKTEQITSYGYMVKNLSVTVLDASIKMAFKLFEAKKYAEEIAHELRTHQMELQMQNEELLRYQEELEALRQKYFNLYDMAPVAYFTVGKNGRILEANLTAADFLGQERAALTSQSFSAFICPEDQDRYYHHRKKLLESGSPQSCELMVRRHDGGEFLAAFKAIAAHDDQGEATCRVVALKLYRENSFIKSKEGLVSK